jgi:hypothetical protein
MAQTEAQKGDVITAERGNVITWKTGLAAAIILLVGYGGAAAILQFVSKTLSFRVASGWEAYAGLVLLALAVERVVQPFSELLGDTPAKGADDTKVLEAKKNTAIVTWAFATEVVPSGVEV